MGLSNIQLTRCNLDKRKANTCLTIQPFSQNSFKRFYIYNNALYFILLIERWLRRNRNAGVHRRIGQLYLQESKRQI